MVENSGVQPIGVSLEAVTFFLLLISVFLFFIWRNLSSIRKALEGRNEGTPIEASVVLPDGAVQVTVVAPAPTMPHSLAAGEPEAVYAGGPNLTVAPRAIAASSEASTSVGRILAMVDERRNLLDAYRVVNAKSLDDMRDADWTHLGSLVAKASVLYPDIDRSVFDRASEAVTGFPVAILDTARRGLRDVPSGDPRVADIEAQYASYWAGLRRLDEAMAAALVRHPT